MTRPAPLLRTARPDLYRAVPRGTRPPEPIPPTSTLSSAGVAALLGLEPASSNVAVSESSVTGLPAIQSGVDLVAHAVGAMMADADVFAPDGTQLDTPPIIHRPTTLLGSFEFWTQLVDTLMKRGNYVAILADYDAMGYPRQAVPVHPDAVSLDDSTGIPTYTIHGREYRWDEVLHIRHGAPVGSFWGCGIVERYRLAVSRQLHEAEYGRSAFASGGVPSAVIQLDKATVTHSEAEAVQERWIERHGSGTRKPTVIGKALSITPLSWSPEDAEFIEARRLSVAEAALMCGLDPSDLGASIGGSGLTYANLTDRQLARVLSSFMPWMRLIEESFSDQLPGRSFVRGSVEALLRSSTRERFETYEIGQRIGVYTTEELRELERRPSLPVNAENTEEQS